MGLFTDALDLAEKCAIAGTPLAKLGDFMTCFIAKDTYLYVGIKGIGSAPIDLKRFPWADVQQVFSKTTSIRGNIVVTVQLSRPIVDLAQSVAKGGVFAGLLGVLGAAIE